MIKLDALIGAGTTTRLAGGDTGYYMRRPDDCFAAAIATCLQVPLSQVPDFRLDARSAAGESIESIARSTWARIEEWSAERSLSVAVHESRLPIMDLRWIGVCRRPDMAGAFQDHCLVMSYGDVLFDPNPPNVQALYGMFGSELANVLVRARRWGPGDVTYGLTFTGQQARKER